MVDPMIGEASTAPMPTEEHLGSNWVVQIGSSDRLDIRSRESDDASGPKSNKCVTEKGARII
jgi:hypothetical protein